MSSELDPAIALRSSADLDAELIDLQIAYVVEFLCEQGIEAAARGAPARRASPPQAYDPARPAP